jgi:hypothetical protein
MNFSPPEFTFDDFQKSTSEVLSKFSFIAHIEYEIEDSVPWINLTGSKVIKPKDALKILESLQASIVDEVLFNSLRGKEMRIVVNGKFHFTKDELSMGFDNDYAHDFGTTIEEMKTEYNL